MPSHHNLLTRIVHILDSQGSQNTAAILGTLLTTVALTICITLIWPFGNVVEKIFAGGTFFFVFWAALFYWAILANNGRQAWVRVLSIFMAALIINLSSIFIK